MHKPVDTNANCVVISVHALTHINKQGNKMQELESLIEQAVAEQQAKRYPGAEKMINGKLVEARIVSQTRVTTSRKIQKPSVMWKVDGKRVPSSEINEALA
jgi:transcriptional regulator with AAA-type ATPase domain